MTARYSDTARVRAWHRGLDARITAAKGKLPENVRSVFVAGHDTVEVTTPHSERPREITWADLRSAAKAHPGLYRPILDLAELLALRHGVVEVTVLVRGPEESCVARTSNEWGAVALPDIIRESATCLGFSACDGRAQRLADRMEDALIGAGRVVLGGRRVVG